MAGEHVLTFSDNSFDTDVLKSDLPVLVDFWATWCGPCQRITPIVEELAAEFAGKAKVGKLNVDENQQAAIDYGVQSIPTLLIFKGGEVVDRVIGAVPKRVLQEALRKQV